MIEELAQLPPPEKKVVAKVLYRRGYSTREIEDILEGVSDSSVLRYAEMETPDELKQFEAKIEQSFADRELRVAAKSLRRIEDKIPSAQIKDALAVYQAMRNKPNAQIAIQNNMTIDFE